MAKKTGRTKANNGRPGAGGINWRGMHRAVDRDARSMERVREKGYSALNDAIDQLYANLRTTQRGYGRQLTRGNERNLDRILSKVANTRAASRRAVHAYDKGAKPITDSRYGAMLSPALNPLRKQVTQPNKRAVKAAESGARVGRAQANTSEGIVDIIRASAAEQKAGARAVAADALNQRTTEDTALIAQQHHDIRMARIQAQIQAQQAESEFERSKQLALYNAKLATGNLPGQDGDMLNTAVNELGNAASFILSQSAAGVDAETIRQNIMAMYADASPQEGMALQRLVDTLTSDTSAGPDNAVSEVMGIVRGIPGWEKAGEGKKDHLRDWVSSVLRANLARTVADEDKKAADPNTSDEDRGPVGSYLHEMGALGGAYHEWNKQMWEWLL